MRKASPSPDHPSSRPARDPLLKTKLYVPQIHANWLPRPRLTARLAQGLVRPLTLISAPAGSGKTTLVSEWHASPAGRDYPLAWLSLDEDDNDPARFWDYVIAALQALQSGIGVEALAMLRAGWPQLSPPRAFLTSLLNDLADLAADGALVLDDYHAIESRVIHDSLTYLLEHLPPHLHIIVASRTDPPWPLARLRVRDQLVEIRAADLRFTPEEATMFLNQVMELGLMPEDLAALEARTEGWIAGLQMAAIALKDHSPQSRLPQVSSSMRDRSDGSNFIAAFTGSNRYVLDYLVEEVLRRQTESVQTFLLQTCILDRLSGPLCDAVTGRSDSQAILTMLEQANLFTTSLDAERRWYRYHHLFAEFLYSRLEYTLRDRIPDLHCRAAEWYEQNGLAGEAAPHALAAQDWERAARLIEQTSQGLLMRGEMLTLQSWLQTLPADRVRAQPRLSILMAWLHVWSLSIQAAEDRLRDAERAIAASDALAAQERTNLQSEIEAIRSVVYVFRGDLRRAAELARQARKHLAEDNWFLRSVIAFDESLSHVMNGDTRAANQALAEAVQFSQKAHNVMFAAIAMSQLAEQYIAQGQLHQAAAVYRQTIQLAEDQSTSPPPTTSMAYSGFGEVLREWNQLEEATRYLNQGIELGLQWSEAMTLDGYISLARVKQAQGDAEAASAASRKVREMAPGFDLFSMGDETLSAFQVRMWIAQGDLEAVTQWVQACESANHTQRSETPPPYMIREYTQLGLAHAQLALGKPKETLALVEQLVSEADARGRKGIVLEATMLKALALQAMGDMAQATTVLEQALLWAEPEGYIRLFVDKGKPMRLLLQRMKRQQAGAEGERMKPPAANSPLAVYVDKLLAVYPKDESEMLHSKDEHALHPSAFILSPLAEPLSERELDVLRLIAEGLSNQDIAAKLVIAVSTVKTHVNNIFTKLGVQSRTQALARAHELKLL